MHEYSIVQALLQRVEAEARGRRATAVHRLSIRVGALAGVEPELLASAFSIFKQRTLCDRAELEIQSVAARWDCPQCGAALAAGAVLRCPGCGVPARLQAGDEIMLDRIEMEVV